MKRQEDQSVPHFIAQDVYGATVSSESLKGKSTLLSFQRNVGCPICHLQVHEMLKKADLFKKQGVQVILVYQSKEKNMRKYLGKETYPFTFVPDPENRLYTLFSVTSSVSKMMKGILHGAMGKMMAGKKLMKYTAAMDGDMTMVGADFLLDERGKIIKAHYGDYVGDKLSVEEILSVFKQLPATAPL